LTTLKQANEQYRDKSSGLEEELQALFTQIQLMTEEMQRKDEEMERLYLQKEGRAPSTYMIKIN
jgi:hypothetical protein